MKYVCMNEKCEWYDKYTENKITWEGKNLCSVCGKQFFPITLEMQIRRDLKTLFVQSKEEMQLNEKLSKLEDKMRF